jgi:hypothetical protein
LNTVETADVGVIDNRTDELKISTSTVKRLPAVIKVEYSVAIAVTPSCNTSNLVICLVPALVAWIKNSPPPYVDVLNDVNTVDVTLAVVKVALSIAAFVSIFNSGTPTVPVNVVPALLAGVKPSAVVISVAFTAVDAVTNPFPLTVIFLKASVCGDELTVAKVKADDTLADPLKLTVHVASPEADIDLDVVNVGAEPEMLMPHVPVALVPDMLGDPIVL